MIKFFRQIRLHLLGSGKTTKYFKYAIGEIILVMVGILLALQVNNWNENRKNTNAERDYYCGLLNDFELDMIQLEKLKDKGRASIDAGKQLLRNLHQKNRSKNELMTEYIKAVRSVAYVPINDTYVELMSSGNLGLLNHKYLKKSLINYYSELESINDKIASNRTFRVKRLQESWENVLEFGWQEKGISGGLNLDEDLLNHLPKIDWHLDENNKYFKKFEEVIFIGMAISNREIELFDEILRNIETMRKSLNPACND